MSACHADSAVCATGFRTDSCLAPHWTSSGEHQKQADDDTKVFIAGATGVLGRRLVRLFCARGDSVVGLVRRPVGEQTVIASGGEPHRADLFNADALARGAEGCDVIIHAATSIPVKTRPRAEDWEMNDRIRREGTRALTACATKVGAKLYIQQSVIWVARSRDGSFFDEDSPAQPDHVSRSAFDGEEIAREAGQKYGFHVSVLRCGWFYGTDAAHTRFFAESLKARRLPIIGRGDAVWALLHLDDAASAFVTATTTPRSGIWHVVDDQVVSVREFLNYFAERLAAPRPRRVPAWLARLVAGSYAVDFFIIEEKTSAELASEYDVHPEQIHRWKATAANSLVDRFSDKRHKREADKDRFIEELYKEVGPLKVE